MPPQPPSTSTFSLRQTLINTSAARTYSSGLSKPNFPGSSTSSGYNSTLVSSSGSIKSYRSSHSISSGSSTRTMDASDGNSTDEKLEGLKLTSSNPLPLAVPAVQAHAHETHGRKGRFSSLFSSGKSKSRKSGSDSKSEKRRPPPLELDTADKTKSAAGKIKTPRTPLFDWRFRNHNSMAVQGAGKSGEHRRPAGWGLLLQG